WYQETQSGGSRSSLRGRVKALLCTGAGPCNLAHLANLFTSHMYQHCLPASKQESKLSKLQRRLTCPTAPESHRLPQFTNIEITKEYLALSKKLGLLAKFLGFLASLPYTQFTIDATNKNAVTKVISREVNYATPKEKVLANDLALRNYSQPAIDLLELCPHLRDLNVLLSTCRVSQDQKDMASYRHITPVSLTLNPEDRIKNKEKELQARLEEELLKSQPSSTRRVLELVIERVTSACVRELSAHTLTEVRERAARAVAKMAGLVPAAQQIYAAHLQLLRSAALEAGRGSARRRGEAAVAALLAAAPPPLVALVVRAATTKLAKWLHDNWTTHAVLCKDIESEVKTLVALGDLGITTCHKNSVDVSAMTTPGAQFSAQHVSAAACVINLKRAILQLSVDLCVVFVSRKPKEVNESFLLKLHAIWNVCCPDRKRSPPQEITLPERREELSPQFRNFEDEERAPTPISDEEIPTKIVILNPDSENVQLNSENLLQDSEKLQQNSESLPQKSGSQGQEGDDSDVNLEFFDRILCPRNIMLLSDGKSVDVWEAMATVLVFLLKHDYLSEDSLTEQCLAVYRQDWSQSVLESLSTCMKSVSARWSRSSTGKFTLFLDFLAEYCGDMDYDPSDPIEG
ncbi:hypothetical protein SFRURICE_005833, partial [Spodoptera frugiperda]